MIYLGGNYFKIKIKVENSKPFFSVPLSEGGIERPGSGLTPRPELPRVWSPAN